MKKSYMYTMDVDVPFLLSKACHLTDEPLYVVLDDKISLTHIAYLQQMVKFDLRPIVGVFVDKPTFSPLAENVYFNACDSKEPKYLRLFKEMGLLKVTNFSTNRIKGAMAKVLENNVSYTELSPVEVVEYELQENPFHGKGFFMGNFPRLVTETGSAVIEERSYVFMNNVRKLLSDKKDIFISGLSSTYLTFMHLFKEQNKMLEGIPLHFYFMGNEYERVITHCSPEVKEIVDRHYHKNGFFIMSDVFIEAGLAEDINGIETRKLLKSIYKETKDAEV